MFKKLLCILQYIDTALDLYYFLRKQKNVKL